MRPDDKAKKSANAGGTMPLLQPKPRAAAEPIITFRPNPGLKAEGYYELHLKHHSEMMDALGKK